MAKMSNVCAKLHALVRFERCYIGDKKGAKPLPTI
jgi:hypothetical protein